MTAATQLDKYFPPCGECLFCGHKDKRHRLWDTIISLSKGGESVEFIAALYDKPIEAIELVLQIKPYQRTN